MHIHEALIISHDKVRRRGWKPNHYLQCDTAYGKFQRCFPSPILGIPTCLPYEMRYYDMIAGDWEIVKD